MRLKIRLAFTIIMAIFSFAAAKPALAKSDLVLSQFDTTLLATKDWIISKPSPNAVFLISRTKMQSILVREYRSAVDPSAVKNFLIGNYRSDIIQVRKRELALRGFRVRNLNSQIGQLNAQQFGQFDFELDMPFGSADFSERLWSTRGRIWQLTISNYGTTFPSTSSQNETLSKLMTIVIDSTSKKSNHASWIKFILPEASASETVHQSEVRPDTEPSHSTPESSKISCSTADVDPKFISAGEPSLKLNSSSVAGCITGAGDAFPKMIESTKKAFVSGLEDIEAKTEENLKKRPCEEPPKPNGLSGWITYSSEIEIYNTCLESAGTTAIIQKAGDIVSETGSGVAALAQWVWTTKDPVAVISEILRKKVTGFECLNAETQARMFCEFVSRAAIATAVAVATEGASAAAAAALSGAKGVTILEEGLRGARSILTPLRKISRTSTESKSIAEGLKSVNTADHESKIAVDAAKNDISKINAQDVNRQHVRVDSNTSPPISESTHENSDSFRKPADSSAGKSINPVEPASSRSLFNTKEKAELVYGRDGSVETNKFRDAYIAQNLGGENKFISFAIDGKNTRVGALVLEKLPDGRLTVQLAGSGEKRIMTPHEILSARFSQSSRDHFFAESEKAESQTLRERLKRQAEESRSPGFSSQSTNDIHSSKAIAEHRTPPVNHLEELGFPSQEIIEKHRIHTIEKISGNGNIYYPRLLKNLSSPPTLESFSSTLKQHRDQVFALKESISRKELGQVRFEISKDKLYIKSLHVKGDENKGKGVGGFLIHEILLRHQNIRSITASLAEDNFATIEKGLKKGLSCVEALKLTPGYRIRAQAGFTKIVGKLPANCKSERGNLEFTVEKE